MDLILQNKSVSNPLVLTLTSAISDLFTNFSSLSIGDFLSIDFDPADFATNL
jgi:hypothetical protein